MRRRGIGLAILCLSLPLVSLAQASDSARAEIVRSLIAEEAAARMDMPLGSEGVVLSELGQINTEKLQKQIKKNGKSVAAGRVVKVTKIEFENKTINIELDGGGKDKKGLLGGHVQVGVGGMGTPGTQTSNAPRAKGSSISLTFANKVPADLSSDQLRQLLGPVLDFSKQTLASTSIESLPPEFQEAVRAKRAEVGMDEETVLLAMGRPNRRTQEKVDGVEQVTWQYDGRGVHKTFVTFENSIVVKIHDYQ